MTLPRGDIVESIREELGVDLVDNLSDNEIWNESYLTTNGGINEPYTILISVSLNRNTENNRSPTVLLPAAIRASLILVIIAPTIGEEAEVPEAGTNLPLNTPVKLNLMKLSISYGSQ